MPMRFQNVLENARLAIQVLVLGLLLSFIINLLLIFGWHSAQEKIVVHLPPEIPVSGLNLKANAYPSAYIYSFAFYIWQSINNWPNNGVQDYQKSIDTYSPFLTPRFKQFLIRDYNRRINEGEIQDRVRTLQGVDGSSFSISDVKDIGHSTWLVHLHMRLTEHMNINGNQVKDVAIDYVLRVVRYQIDARSNPWGLALDGFAQDPIRVKTYI
jgi:integrating conjugative element protein (TIGR03746 family)